MRQPTTPRRAGRRHRDVRRRPQHRRRGAGGPRLVRRRQPAAGCCRRRRAGRREPAAATQRSRSSSTSAPGSFFAAPCRRLATRRRPAGTPTLSSSRRPTTCSCAARRPSAARTRCRATAGCSTGSSASASCSRPARRRRPRHRHLGPERPPARRPDRRGVRHRRDGPAAGRPWCRFGFKYGIPVDADFVADCGSCPTRTGCPSCGPAPGRDGRASDYVLGQPGAEEFLRPTRRCWPASPTGYLREGKRFATVAIGCTGGKHRSVAMAEELARRLHARGRRRRGRPPRPGARVSPPDARRPGGGRPRAAATAWPPSLSALRLLVDDARRRRPDRGRHGRRRRRLVRPAAPRARRAAARRPADGAGRAVRRRRLGPDLGRGAAAPVPQRRRAARPRVGNLLIVGAVGAARRPRRRPRLGRPAARRHRAGCCRWPLVPLDIAAEVRGLDPDDPDALTSGPRPGRGRDHRRPCRRRSRSTRPTRRPARRRWRRSRDADWVVLGPGSWFTSVIPHLLVPDWPARIVSTDARVRRGPQPGDAGGGDRRASPGRPPRGARRARPRPQVDAVLADAAAWPRTSPS